MPSPQEKLKSYARVACETAPPGQIVLMLFDGILRFMDTARQGFAIEQITKRNEVVSNNIIKAQAIVSELQSSLDMSVPGELPMTLYRLYDYFYRRLNEANSSKRVEPINEIEPFVRELRDSWDQMLRQQDDSKLASQELRKSA